jgi:hypothetical protein
MDGTSSGAMPADGLRHDGADHVHELRNAGRFHTIRVVDHGDQRPADDQRIFEVVNLLDKLRRLRPARLAQSRGASDSGGSHQQNLFGGAR